MIKSATATVLKILDENFDAVVTAWLEVQSDEGVKRSDLFSEREVREQTVNMLRAFAIGVRDGIRDNLFDLAKGNGWEDLRGIIAEIAQERVRRGGSPTEMSAFVLSLKTPIFNRLQERLADDTDKLIQEVWLTSRVVDAFAIYTNDLFIKEREQVIERQRDEMQELSTPVVELWDKILTLPLIGTLDSARAQEVMESLLEAILDHQSEVVIIDITGVQTVDTQVAQHLLRTAAAVRLMGAECIISGISPKIAQTMVQLGVDVEGVTTRSTIRSGLLDAFQRVGYVITKRGDAASV